MTSKNLLHQTQSALAQHKQASHPPPNMAYRVVTTKLKSLIFGNHLQARVFRGGAWLGSANVGEQTARFARNLILVRLLAPSVFGTMAIVLAAAGVVQCLTDVGAKEALIQNPRGGERHYINAAWWIAFLRALFTYSLLFAAAPWIARFYGNNELAPLLRVAVLGVFFEGAMSTVAYLRIKEMRFSKWALIYHGGSVCGIILTVVLGIVYRNVWALVIGTCSESVFRCILSYIVCPYWPTLRVHWPALKDLLQFSKGLFGLSLLNLIFSRADVFVLAKLFSPAELGIYTMAVYLIQVPAGFLINLMSQLFLPMFSKIQEDVSQTNVVLLKIARIVFSLGLPVVIFLSFCGRPLLHLLYGNAYAAAAPALAVAGCVALLNVLNAQITAVFYSSGKPALHRGCVLLMAVLMAITTYPLARLTGTLGGQLAALIAIAAGFAFQVYRLRWVTGFTAGNYGRVFIGAIPVSLVVVAACSAAVIFVPEGMLTILIGLMSCSVAFAFAGHALLEGVGGKVIEEVIS